MRQYTFILYVLGMLIFSCKKANIIPEPQAYRLEVPADFPGVPVFADNVMSRQGVELGRMLFYDKRLSGNNQISCASCHHQSLAFSDGLALSTQGFSGKQLPRSAPALMNLAWENNGLFWDGGSTNLESQAFGPLTNEDEMHQNLEELVYELQQIPAYVKKFKAVFGDDIKTGYIAMALAQFQRTLVTGNAPYDRYRRGEPGAEITAQQKIGLALFQQHCATCHAGVLFTDNEYHNNGIDADFTNDALEGLFLGRFRITYNLADLGKFKTPTLRNIALTAPYMHDGRFKDLAAVLQHYADGVKRSATTDAKLYTNGQPGLRLSKAEQENIIAFLQTLTDDTFINNRAFSEPALP
ncbi:cytochrome-c peroxidase [Chitinophaga silvatica]|uniref:Cytochrome-c peroxidase n=1 Tax=Chitinophaga silvatica TaxID=2282649 RepID=A0A3E1YH71_9BACT|nr:cytochrome c peroxidase [Chitinophaga silvatica]RFS26741.1 cytochrome-c peroxidase [Chitinophaga silvatica]